MSGAIVEQLKEIIAYQLDVNLGIDEIDENVSLYEDGLGLDSIAIVDLLIAIEKQEAMRPYDLAAGPLIRFTLIRLANLDHVLVISKHHIISDVTSRQILWRELTALYNAHAFNTPHGLEPLDMQYCDYAVWQQQFMESENYRRQKTYWLTQLSGPLPRLDLPIDYPRREDPGLTTSYVHKALNPGLVENLRTFGLRCRTIFPAIFILAFYTLLVKYTGQKDIIIGTIFQGRNPDKKKLKKIIGLFVNHLPIRLNTAEINGDDITIMELMDLVNKKTREAYNNQDYPFEDLTRTLQSQNSAQHSPLFRVVFNMLKVPVADVEWQGLREWHPYTEKSTSQKISIESQWQRFEPDNYINSQYDLSLYVRDELNNINVKLLYPRNLFKRQTIERMLTQYCNILLEIAAQPAKKIQHLQIITEEEKCRILNYFNDTHKTYILDKTVQGLFEEQVERTPFHIALVTAETGQGVKPCQVPARNINAHVSYKELNQRANRLACFLRTKGARPDTAVGIMAPRSAEMVIGLYGIMKAGSACLLLDPALPRERIKYMIQNNRTLLLISLPHFLNQMDIKPTNLEVVDLFDPSIYRYEVPGSNLETVNRPGDLAYIIYTSGTTGRPKGIMIQHRSLHDCIEGTADNIDFSPGKIILSLSPITFDIFVLETYLPLSRGLRIVMADENLQRDSVQLAVLLVTHLVEILQSPLTRMQLLTNHGCNWKCLERVKEIIIGGEVFPEKLLIGLKGLPSAKIYNMYGPSETTVWATMKEITFAETVDLGKPLANNRIYILDKYLNLQPVGVIGEICIAGEGLARGYLNNPELTAERFKRAIIKSTGTAANSHLSLVIRNRKRAVIRQSSLVFGSTIMFSNDRSSKLSPSPNDQCPMTNDRSYKLYKTGDLGRWLWDGNIQFFGRIDQQVKIRGHRIELGEIETLLDRYPDVQKSVVTVRQFQPGDHRLVAYIVRKGMTTPTCDCDTLRQYLHTQLPDYMVPAAFVVMEAFPLTSSGKINRQQLPFPTLERPEPEKHYALPRDDLERQLISIWEKVLKVKPIGLTDDFFKLGGYSLLAVRLFSCIEKELCLWRTKKPMGGKNMLLAVLRSTVSPVSTVMSPKPHMSVY